MISYYYFLLLRVDFNVKKLKRVHNFFSSEVHAEY